MKYSRVMYLLSKNSLGSFALPAPAMECGCCSRPSLLAPPPFSNPKPVTFNPSFLLPFPRGRTGRHPLRHPSQTTGRGTAKATLDGNSGEHDSSSYSSARDDGPYVVLPEGQVSYLDEQDIVTFLDPPRELIPLDPESYNPAAYLWKKISDIPEGRHHRLLYLLKSRLISRLWQLTGMRYTDDKLAKKCASNLLSMGTQPMPLEFWNCKTSSGPLPLSWLNNFKMTLFRAKDGGTYGRILLGGSILAGVANSLCPLYFTVRELNEVISTEQPCDLAYEFGDGLLDLPEYPDGFPKSVACFSKAPLAFQ